MHLMDLQPQFTRENIFVTSNLLPAHQSPSGKGSTLKGKNLPKFFPFRIDPFTKGSQNNFDGIAVPEHVSILFKSNTFNPNFE